MIATTRTARRIIKARRTASQKRTIATHIRRTGADTATVKAVTAALRKTARTLRAAGHLGRVQTRTERITARVVGPVYRYTATQIALIAAAYRPRKAAYRAVAARLTLAA